MLTPFQVVSDVSKVHEASKIPERLWIVTGMYIIQCNRARASYNQFESDATCNLCDKTDESVQVGNGLRLFTHVGKQLQLLSLEFAV